MQKKQCPKSRKISEEEKEEGIQIARGERGEDPTLPPRKLLFAAFSCSQRQDISRRGEEAVDGRGLEIHKLFFPGAALSREMRFVSCIAAKENYERHSIFCFTKRVQRKDWTDSVVLF